MTILKQVSKTLSIYDKENHGLVFTRANLILTKKQVRINDRIDGKSTSCYSMIIDSVGSRFMSNLRKNSTSTTTVFSCYFLDRKKDAAYNILLEQKIIKLFTSICELSINSQCLVSYCVNSRDYLNIEHFVDNNKMNFKMILTDYNTKKQTSNNQNSTYLKDVKRHKTLLEKENEVENKKEVAHVV